MIINMWITYPRLSGQNDFDQWNILVRKNINAKQI